MKNYPCNPLKKGIVLNLEIDPKATFCDLRIPRDWIKENYTKWLKDMKIYCESVCRPACTKTTFHTTPSFFHWPAVGSRDEQLVLERHRLMAPTERMKDTDVKENALVLNIYLETFDVRIVDSEPKYTLSVLVATIGGGLGLFLGFSFITAMEMCEFLLDILLYFCHF